MCIYICPVGKNGIKSASTHPSCSKCKVSGIQSVFCINQIDIIYEDRVHGWFTLDILFCFQTIFSFNAQGYSSSCGVLTDHSHQYCYALKYHLELSWNIHLSFEVYNWLICLILVKHISNLTIGSASIKHISRIIDA